jgi:hypothetical protein
MNGRTPQVPPVPARLAVASIVGLWACYFVLATLRGAVLGYEFSWELVSRRLIVVIASMAVTALLWPLSVLLARRPLWQLAVAILVAAFPASVLLAAINSWVFADLNTLHHEPRTKVEMTDGVSIVSDGTGRMVIDLSGPQRPPSPPVPVAPPPLPGTLGESGAPPAVAPPRAPGGEVIPDVPAEAPAVQASSQALPVATAQSGKAGRRPMSVAISQTKALTFWEENADLAIGRYYLLLAWAAIYLALANAQQARAAERREGEFRRAAQVAELRSLRHQVNPHFLFNTLNSLSALVLTGRHEGAERMIQMLAGFYRRSLGGDPTGDLTLGEEIGLQKLYLEIEAVRFPERLRTVIDVPEALTDACVPGMILQPLIENSIKHGVARTTSPVTITIAAWPEGERLVMSIGDDGPGTGGGQSEGRSEGLGIGLANVRDRLQARFGDDASLDAEAMPEGGFRTVMRLPLQRRNG